MNVFRALHAIKLILTPLLARPFMNFALRRHSGEVQGLHIRSLCLHPLITISSFTNILGHSAAHTYS